MVIAWGQFMDHDLTLTGTPLGEIKLILKLLASNNLQYFRSSQSQRSRGMLPPSSAFETSLLQRDPRA